ncbi:hypothetical protein B0H10DRAFT_548343 [Mycena sp. CBHHK59/15]|nr:hypothetical protein B0H10DRAFT_548343 [Mycena sp. CBHHK59/15]
MMRATTDNARARRASRLPSPHDDVNQRAPDAARVRAGLPSSPPRAIYSVLSLRYLLCNLRGRWMARGRPHPRASVHAALAHICDVSVLSICGGSLLSILHPSRGVRASSAPTADAGGEQTQEGSRAEGHAEGKEHAADCSRSRPTTHPLWFLALVLVAVARCSPVLSALLHVSMSPRHPPSGARHMRTGCRRASTTPTTGTYAAGACTHARRHARDDTGGFCLTTASIPPAGAVRVGQRWREGP